MDSDQHLKHGLEIGNTHFMDNPLSTVPWNTPALWQAANAALSASLQRNWLSMTDLIREAHTIRRHYEALFPIMDNLCHRTCPACTENCCRRAWVWADFKDLLFMHLADIAVPPQQLLRNQGDRCRYAGSAGCQLDRLQRPFICTWYLCPAQSQRLDRQPTAKRKLACILDQIKKDRKRMEAAYIQAIT